ncbi:hypothetical protein [Kordiimonas sp.]|uniref:hypothetical protein n=1 Tax=Kordiimonas sp. TaxID=1970157 RepID=UPI003B525FCF
MSTPNYVTIDAEGNMIIEKEGLDLVRDALNHELANHPARSIVEVIERTRAAFAAVLLPDEG